MTTQIDTPTLSQPAQTMLWQKSHDSHTSTIELSHSTIGEQQPTWIAGPCSIESESQINDCAKSLKQAGATILRGGAFKPRTSPYDFQGHGEKALIWMQQAALQYELNTISEVMSPDQISLLAGYVDMIQVGARNMQNTALLKALGRQNKPILLKRSPSATYHEWLMAAEYILSEGNQKVCLCERGIRSFDNTTRNMLDLAGVAYLKQTTHLPVLVDPSHGTGLRQLIAPMTHAALAAGADGTMIEVHPNPDQSISDAKQAIDFASFRAIRTHYHKQAEDKQSRSS